MRLAGPKADNFDVRLAFLDCHYNPEDYRQPIPNTIQCLHKVINNYRSGRSKDSADEIFDSIRSARVILIHSKELNVFFSTLFGATLYQFKTLQQEVFF